MPRRFSYAFYAIVIVILLFTGCMSVSDMTSAQLRATNGMAQCAQATTMYGKGSAITVNADDLRKGVNAKGKTVIVCGDATMSIEHNVGETR